MISKACMIIAAVASFSFVSSLDTDNTQMTNGSESLGIKDLVEEIYRQFIADLTVGNNSVCSCTNDCCGCCAHIVIGILHIDETACVNFCYIPAELALDFTFTLNDIVIIEEKISVRNPPRFVLEFLLSNLSESASYSTISSWKTNTSRAV